MTLAPPTLRPAVDADSPAVQALVFAALREHGMTPDPTGTDSDLAQLEANFARRGGDFSVLVDADGQIVGTCGLYPHGESEIELRKMYLTPALRGRGQGRRLLHWALRRARQLGFKRITLETADVLQPAIALYEAEGFLLVTCGCATSRCNRRYQRDL
jgi:putative acetyltransferase